VDRKRAPNGRFEARTRGHDSCSVIRTSRFAVRPFMQTVTPAGKDGGDDLLESADWSRPAMACEGRAKT
jgi:hypothetical protein